MLRWPISDKAAMPPTQGGESAPPLAPDRRRQTGRPTGAVSGQLGWVVIPEFSSTLGWRGGMVLQRPDCPNPLCRLHFRQPNSTLVTSH
jgi:hypothetical protein